MDHIWRFGNDLSCLCGGDLTGGVMKLYHYGKQFTLTLPPKNGIVRVIPDRSGKYDELYTYNRELTDQEVQENDFEFIKSEEL